MYRIHNPRSFPVRTSGQLCGRQEKYLDGVRYGLRTFRLYRYNNKCNFGVREQCNTRVGKCQIQQ